MTIKHSLVKRQLRKIFGDSFVIPKEWEKFIQMVDNAYQEFDIDRKMLERSLELSSQELLQANSEMMAIFNAIPDLFFRVDLNGKILDCKAGNTTDLMISRESLIGKSIFEIPNKDAAEQFINAVQIVRERRSSFIMEYSLKLPSGINFYEARVIPFLDDQIIVIIRNISEKRRSEAALLESERKYRALVEESIFGVFIIQDGLFIFVNKRFCEIVGYDHSEIVNKMSPEDLVTPEYISLIKKGIKNIYNRDTQGQHLNFKIKRKDNEIRLVEIISNLIIYNNKPAISGTLLDLTKEKMLEQQLLQSQKMEAIGTLTGGIAHDFNNILTSIIGYSNLLLMGLKEDNKLRRYAEQIINVSDRAAKLISSLLMFSRKEPLDFAPYNINYVVKETELFIKPLIREDISLKIDYTDSEPIIITDKTRFSQILINLVTNAQDAMVGGGLLHIKTDIAFIDQDFIDIKGFGRQGEYAVLSVSDTGIGIDEEIKDKIFEPFFTTKEIGKGTGLGLSTVYGVVQQHNGFIDIDTKKGMGTTFKIYFPISKISTKNGSEPINIVHKKGTETILIAEDNTELRNLIKEILVSSGYKVIDTGDGEEAVENFYRFKNTLDLLILDVILPKMDGRQVYDEAFKIRPDIKALFISGYMKEVAISKGLSQDIAILQKPFSSGALLNKVREMLDSDLR